MRYLVTGGTGFIGRRLIKDLRHAVVLSRDPERARRQLGDDVVCHAWNPGSENAPAEAFEGIDVVVHLAGDPVAAGRWTPEKKQAMWSSRVDGTQRLLAGMESSSARPRILVCASAVGYYGDRGDEELTEDSQPGGDYMADLCRAWESASQVATDLGVRVVMLRIGVVLGRDGGALGKMITPFQLGLGGPLGNGRQWMPWIHLDDIVGLIHFAASEERVSGPMNAVAPVSVTNAEFTQALGAQVRRPTFFPVPEFALGLLFGEMAQVMLASQRAVPKKALDLGYQFTYRTIDVALRAALGSASGKAVSHTAA